MKKNVFILGITAIVISVATVNLYIAEAYFASSSRTLRLVNLQALTNESASENYSGPCNTFEKPYRDLGTNCNCAAGVFKAYPREHTYYCAGSGGACYPGSRLVYYNCDGTIQSESNDRSSAYCRKD